MFKRKSTDTPGVPSPVPSKTVKVEVEFKKGSDSIMSPYRRTVVEVKREDAENFETIERSVDFSETAHGDVSVSRWRIL